MVPTTSARAARAGLALYAPCRPLAVWGWRASWHLVGLLGRRAVPGRTETWSPPMPASIWRELRQEWTSLVGTFDAVAIHQPRQRSRTGLGVLLISDDIPIAFVKLRSHGAAGPLAAEAQALQLVGEARPTRFTAPRFIHLGRCRGWDHLVMSALPPILHRIPSRPPLEALSADITRVLAGLPRQDGVPEHWRPMHGDFTPWNLRSSRGRLTLVDWEDSDWAPPHADVVLYGATHQALGGRPVASAAGAAEAVDFWIDRVSTRMDAAADDVDRAFGERLLQALAASPVGRCSHADH